MPLPRIVAVRPGSPAAAAGLVIGDEIVSVNGVEPTDIIAYQQLVDGKDPIIEIRSGNLTRDIQVAKLAGEPLGIEVSDAVFDRVRTCDNHCEFCFIYQLPKGLRKTLYVKDDDYRLSFLYGNFTTLTRFTEADFERVVEEKLSPLYVSIHTTDPLLRAEMLRNKRGATSLRWLSALLEAGIEVHGQIVLSPGINDGVELIKTLADIVLQYEKLQSVGVVPLGVSRFNKEPRMRPTTRYEAESALDTIHEFQDHFLETLGVRKVFAADEFYLLAKATFPAYEEYEGFPQLENGIGMYRRFEAEYRGIVDPVDGSGTGFFRSIEGAPAMGYRAIRIRNTSRMSSGRRPMSGRPVIVTSTYGASLVGPLVGAKADICEVKNSYFGGNISVTGLLAGADVSRAVAAMGDRHYLIPDVCLSDGRFIDGVDLNSLPARIEVVATNGRALREAVERAWE